MIVRYFTGIDGIANKFDQFLGAGSFPKSHQNRNKEHKTFRQITIRIG
jgi:hypothetical protein